jgi:CBS-domain-containing membrane protein
MVAAGRNRLHAVPVFERWDTRQLVGMVGLHDLLHARTRALQEERRRERVLRIHLPFGPRGAVTEDHPGVI